MEVFWSKIKYRIVPVICLVMAVLASQDVYPEYNWIRYGFILAGILSIFIGGHGNILKGIAILEILISFAVIFQKTNQIENLIEAKKISKLQSTLVSVESCNYRNDWAQRDCAIRNEPKIIHNKTVNEKIANLKLSVSSMKVLQADPSLVAFIIFSCALPWLSYLSAKKIEIEKEIIYQDRIIYQDKIIEVEKEVLVHTKFDAINFIKDLFSNVPALRIEEQYNVDRRTVSKLRARHCTRVAHTRTTNAQSTDNLVNLRIVKKEIA